MTGLYFRLALLLLFGAACCILQANSVVDVTIYGARPNSGEDATVAFQQALAAVRAIKGRATLSIPPGRYDFFSMHATHRACYFSNATEPGSDAIRTIALDLAELKDLTIEGPGARLVMRGKMTMLAARGCAGLTIRGLEFDFARPTVSEITAVEKGEGYWIGEVHPDSDFRIEEGRLEWYGEDWKGGHDLVQTYDPVSQTTWRSADPTSTAKIVDLGNRRLRFDLPAGASSEVVVGRTYQFRDTRRDQVGMGFERCRNVRIEDVKVRAMAGFGMLFQFTENIHVQRLDVSPSPTSGRTCVAAADILHFSGCRGQVRILDSVLSAAHDDAINIHGTHLRIVGKLDERRIRVRFMHPQTWGFSAFTAGDELDFVRKETLRSYAKGKVVSVEMTVDPHEQILTLAHPFPSEITVNSDVVENVTWTPSVEIARCEISKVPTRGILATTRRPVRIVGNRFFRTPMPAILVEDDAAGWYESGPVHDLRIEGNSFFECAGESIQINPQNVIDAGAVHRNLRVIGNSFVLVNGLAISAKSVEGLRIERNRFQMKGKAAKVTDLVRTSATTGLRIAKNIVEKKD